MTAHYNFPVFLHQVSGIKKESITAKECDVTARSLRANYYFAQ